MNRALRIAAASFGASALSLLLGFFVYSSFQLHVSAVALHASAVERLCLRHGDCRELSIWNKWVYETFVLRHDT